ncbi:MAG: heme-binding protein [Actinomycetia bacterium]|nr:heme-binding protein [Actinomycetes bacterium]
MPFQSTSAHRVMAAVVGAGAVFLATSVAAHADPPNCTAADLAGVMTGVAAATSTYLFTHPQVNEFLTSLRDLPDEQKRAELIAYMDANPQVRAELLSIRQPSRDFRNRCG